MYNTTKGVSETSSSQRKGTRAVLIAFLVAFAPAPPLRPRSYSTSHRVWMDTTCGCMNAAETDIANGNTGWNTCVVVRFCLWLAPGAAAADPGAARQNRVVLQVRARYRGNGNASASASATPPPSGGPAVFCSDSFVSRFSRFSRFDRSRSSLSSLARTLAALRGAAANLSAASRAGRGRSSGAAPRGS